MRSAVSLALAVTLLTGCAAHKHKPPVNVDLDACRVTKTWVDEQGVERKRCQCMDAVEYGFDIATQTRLFHCR